jgi:hypothetical protein
LIGTVVAKSADAAQLRRTLGRLALRRSANRAR